MSVEALYPKDAEKLAEKLADTCNTLETNGDSGLGNVCDLMDSAAGYIRWLEDRHYGEKSVKAIECHRILPGEEVEIVDGWEIWETHGGQDGFLVLLAKNVDRRKGEP